MDIGSKKNALCKFVTMPLKDTINCFALRRTDYFMIFSFLFFSFLSSFLSFSLSLQAQDCIGLLLRNLVEPVGRVLFLLIHPIWAVYYHDPYLYNFKSYLFILRWVFGIQVLYGWGWGMLCACDCQLLLVVGFNLPPPKWMATWLLWPSSVLRQWKGSCICSFFFLDMNGKSRVKRWCDLKFHNVLL